MKKFTFGISTTGYKTYEIKAESIEEAAKILWEAEEDGLADEKYLIESEGEDWNLSGYMNKSPEEKLLDMVLR